MQEARLMTATSLTAVQYKSQKAKEKCAQFNPNLSIMRKIALLIIKQRLHNEWCETRTRQSPPSTNWLCFLVFLC